jgi:hypothetical protein
MKSKNIKTMKEFKIFKSYIFYALLGGVLLLNVSCDDSFVQVVKKYKLEITSSDGNVYYTSEFNEKLNCIEFKGVKIEPIRTHGTFKVCGSFTVGENIYYNCEGIECF